MRPLIALTVALAPLTLTACGSARLDARKAEVKQAGAEYAQAHADLAAFQTEEAVKAKASYIAGVAAFDAYMAVQAPDAAGPDQAEAWFEQRWKALEGINQAFKDVQLGPMSAQGMISRVRQGEAAARLVAELEAMLGPKPDQVLVSKTLYRAVDKAVYYFNAVPVVYVADAPELAKAHPEEVQKAEAGLKAMNAKADAVRALVFGE